MIDALRAVDDFERTVTRATLVVRSVGVADAALGEGCQAAIGVYQAAVTPEPTRLSRRHARPTGQAKTLP